MSFPPLPHDVADVDARRWETFQPYFADLMERDLNNGELRPWLEDWSQVSRVLSEAVSLAYIIKSQDTADEEAERSFLDVIENVYPEAMRADQQLKERLLDVAALEAAGADMALVLRNMRNEAELFREENVPLITALQKLGNEYDKVTGAMTADWEGEQKNLSQLENLLRAKNRPVRERAWQTMMELWQEERETLNRIYAEMLALRVQVAENAGLPDYRAYAFRDKGRFSYTPEDCFTFHEAIEEVVVPAARRVLEKKREQLELASLRPWDLDVETNDLPVLQPYQEADELIARSLEIFNRVDPQLGREFAAMAEEDLLDLDTRPGKALGGYCANLPLRKRPFIFMNGTGIHDDVQTMLHEAGHAFHAFSSLELPLIWHSDVPMEFAEVASMTMELLAAPFLVSEKGGFYTAAEAARARIEHLEGILLFLPYMAVVDAFQHWAYTHPEEAADPDNCDAAWDDLWHRFMPVTDWSGLEDARVTGWHRKLHIFHSPFYYIEYGMAQVGALQIWRNSQDDPEAALAAYRRALALGGTRTLPELFEAAGAEFRFDSAMLADLTNLIETTIADLEQFVA